MIACSLGSYLSNIISGPVKKPVDEALPDGIESSAEAAASSELRPLLHPSATADKSLRFGESKLAVDDETKLKTSDSGDWQKAIEATRLKSSQAAEDERKKKQFFVLISNGFKQIVDCGIPLRLVVIIMELLVFISSL